MRKQTQKLNDFSQGTSSQVAEPRLGFSVGFLIWNAQMVGVLTLLVRDGFSTTQQMGGKGTFFPRTF